MRNDRLANLLHVEMTLRKLKAVDVARQLGVNAATISRWLNARTHPTPELCALIADRFSLPLDTVLVASGHPPVGSEEEAVLRQEIDDLSDRLNEHANELALLLEVEARGAAQLEENRAKLKRLEQQRVERQRRERIDELSEAIVAIVEAAGTTERSDVVAEIQRTLHEAFGTAAIGIAPITDALN